MKKLLIIFAAFLIFTGPMLSQDDDFRLGIRYLKLGNTYREAGQFENAAKYLNKGQNLVAAKRGWESRYWNAVSNEYLGYLFRDIGMEDEARQYLNSALETFRQIIEMDEGSQEAVDAARQSIRAIGSSMPPERNSSRPNTAMAGLSKTINFDNQRLDNMPSSIPQDVENISIANNKFRDLPGSLMNYKDLRYINAENNKIDEIPSWIGELSDLHYINLNMNRIESLPESIGKLSNLRELILSNNRIEELPSSLCNLQNLEILDIRKNDLSFERLTNLIKCLPNTNILFDEYILKEDAETEGNQGGRIELVD